MMFNVSAQRLTAYMLSPSSPVRIMLSSHEHWPSRRDLQGWLRELADCGGDVITREPYLKCCPAGGLNGTHGCGTLTRTAPTPSTTVLLPRRPPFAPWYWLSGISSAGAPSWEDVAIPSGWQGTCFPVGGGSGSVAVVAAASTETLKRESWQELLAGSMVLLFALVGTAIGFAARTAAVFAVGPAESACFCVAELAGSPPLTPRAAARVAAVYGTIR
eukprot:TRINITY_DN6946_c0_g1_i1.p1 TRINITY_DN6946_c0_g1~~TRINITY_DN6946_c0_g1_i1.p1  ORF type:complete len:217 (+),score=58.28 TRINITY_DN6946_c0_g1_i1:606-1256(+)